QPSRAAPKAALFLLVGRTDHRPRITQVGNRTQRDHARRRRQRRFCSRPQTKDFLSNRDPTAWLASKPTAWAVGRLGGTAGTAGPKRGGSPVPDMRRRAFITLL